MVVVAVGVHFSRQVNVCTVCIRQNRQGCKIVVNVVPFFFVCVFFTYALCYTYGVVSCGAFCCVV